MEFENNVGKVVVVNNMIYVSTMVYRYEVEVVDPIYIWVLYLKVVDELKRMGRFNYFYSWFCSVMEIGLRKRL